MFITSFEFLKCCFNASLVQFANESTRGNNILNLVPVNDMHFVEHVLVAAPFLNSGHKFVVIT